MLNGHSANCVQAIKDAIIARRGKEAKNIAKVAAARRLLTLVYCGMRDEQIRCLARAAEPPMAAPAPCPPPRPACLYAKSCAVSQRKRAKSNEE